MRSRFSPSLVVAILALVLAAGGTGYAAGKVTSRQIKDNTIQSRDLKNNSVTSADLRNGSATGADLKDRSIPRTKLAPGCAAGEAHVFGGCVRRTASGPTSYQAAVDDCSRRNGRLPTTGEIIWIGSHTTDFGWADGNVSQYEFTGDYTGSVPFTPIAFDRGFNSIANASAMLFWHHCVTY